MAHPMLPEWPIVDPDMPPSGCLQVGHHADRDRYNVPWDFFVFKEHLLLVSKERVQLGSNSGEYVTEQYEYPIAGARWFVETLIRFSLHPDDPSAVPRGAITIEEEVGGQVLGVTRGALYGSRLKGIPGYSFDNLSRFEHDTIDADDNRCQMFKMGDPWLFDYGLLDLFKEIANRHERGEF